MHCLCNIIIYLCVYVYVSTFYNPIKRERNSMYECCVIKEWARLTYIKVLRRGWSHALHCLKRSTELHSHTIRSLSLKLSKANNEIILNLRRRGNAASHCLKRCVVLHLRTYRCRSKIIQELSKIFCIHCIRNHIQGIVLHGKPGRCLGLLTKVNYVIILTK